MPPQRPTRRRKSTKRRRLWPRLLAGVMALAVFGALWLIDTGALLQLTRVLILERPVSALLLASTLALLTAGAIFFGRPRPKKRAARKPRGLPSPSE